MQRRDFLKVGGAAAAGALASSIGATTNTARAAEPKHKFKLKYAPHFKAWDEIAYFQAGDNPGRNEPGTGEINYRNVFRHIHKKGFEGVAGMERGNRHPGKEGDQAVIDAYFAADDS